MFEIAMNYDIQELFGFFLIYDSNYKNPWILMKELYIFTYQWEYSIIFPQMLLIQKNYLTVIYDLFLFENLKWKYYWRYITSSLNPKIVHKIVHN